MKKGLRERFANNKFRHGALAVLSSLLVVALLALLVALADSLEEKYSLRADLSFNSMTTQSETTKSVLAALSHDVRIYAVYPQGDEDSTMLALLSRYAAQTPRIAYSVEDIAKNPALVTIVANAAGENAVTADCLIVSCEETGRVRVLTTDDYYTLAYDTQAESYKLSGITYEKAITEAILYVTRAELPGIQILTGHGELQKADTLLMEELLISANYELSRVNLLAGDTLDADNLLMILSPKKDLTEQELQAISAFCAKGGALFITSDFTDPENLENFNALYRTFGFSALPGLVVADKASTGEYFSDYPAQLLPEMLSTAPTSTLLRNSQDVLLLSGARAFETPVSSGTLSASVVLRSGATSYLRNVEDGVMTLDKQEGDKTGAFALAIVSDLAQEGDAYSRAFIIGSSSLFYTDWVISSTYSMEFLLDMIQYLQGDVPIDLDIVPKTATRPGLTPESVAPAGIAAALLPLLTLICALCVLLPRKNL